MVYYQVYFFNLTNPEAVFEGTEKPKLVEVSNSQPREKCNLRMSLSQVGPYTYRQKWLKQNVTWHDNGTISYKTRKVFTYTPLESCDFCLEEDMITTVDVPAISAYLKVGIFSKSPIELANIRPHIIR